MVNKKYKDRLFCLLFGNEEHKDNILSLYNALCHTTYTNEEDIQIYTIDDVIYIKMKNDVSILLDSFLYLWEQQSTFNPNMPIRGFMYFGKMYDRYITENSLNIYGKNEDLLNNCRSLKDYMTLINEIRKNSKIMNFENAVDAAVTYCIEHDVLKTFLLKHRAEVKDVCITEYDEKTFVDGIRAEGRAEGRLSEIFDSVQAEDYGVERGAQKAGMSLPEFEKAMEAAGYKIPEYV